MSILMDITSRDFTGSGVDWMEWLRGLLVVLMGVSCFLYMRRRVGDYPAVAFLGVVVVAIDSKFQHAQGCLTGLLCVLGLWHRQIPEASAWRFVWFWLPTLFLALAAWCMFRGVRQMTSRRPTPE